MGSFISNFDTTAEFTTFSATADCLKPHVSLTKDTNEVHYLDPYYNGHAYVEIGGLNWATMNIGASSVTDYGLFFQWGDTQGYTASQVGSGEGQKYFGWADYKYGNGTSSPSHADMTKYNDADEKTVLENVDDAARANWGGGWRMPTIGEMQTLIDSTTTAWTADYQGSGVSGMTFTDNNDSSKVLFFPACGQCYNGSVSTVGKYGIYWSSSLWDVGSDNARFLFLLDDYWTSNGAVRNAGLSVRAVAD